MYIYIDGWMDGWMCLNVETVPPLHISLHTFINTYIHLQVCVPALCRSVEVEQEVDIVTEDSALPTGKTATNLLNIIEFLNSSCLLRQEDWWSYELCFGKGIRQFHMQIESEMKDERGERVIVQHESLQSQYFLGNAPTRLYTNITALELAAGMLGVQAKIDAEKNTAKKDAMKLRGLVKKQGRETKRKRRGEKGSNYGDEIIADVAFAEELYGDPEEEQESFFENRNQRLLSMAGLPTNILIKDTGPKSLKLEFEGGTPCDLEEVNRSTTVEISCGAKDTIIDIIEDRTCHYYFKVQTPSLCKHPAFQPKKNKMLRMSFSPDPPEGDEDEEDEDEVGKAGLDVRESVDDKLDHFDENTELESLDVLEKDLAEGQEKVSMKVTHLA
jgi:hypothetical protein